MKISKNFTLKEIFWHTTNNAEIAAIRGCSDIFKEEGKDGYLKCVKEQEEYLKQKEI